MCQQKLMWNFRVVGVFAFMTLNIIRVNTRLERQTFRGPSKMLSIYPSKSGGIVRCTFLNMTLRE